MTKFQKPATTPAAPDEAEAMADNGAAASNPANASPTVDLAAMGTDAVKWAEAFDARFNQNEETPDVDDLRAWFANAIMAGHDAGHSAGGEAVRRAGLNDEGDHASLELVNVNAVDISIADKTNIAITVDGRDRVLIAGASIVTLIDNGNHTVLRSPAVAAPEPAEPENLDIPNEVDTMADIGKRDE